MSFTSPITAHEADNK